MQDDNSVFNYKLVKKLLREDASVSVNMKNRSATLGTYVGTVYDRADTKALRDKVRYANRMIKKSGTGKGVRVDVKARLGKNNPHIDHYSSLVQMNDGKMYRDWSRGSSRISLAHGVRFDVYLYDKY